MGDITHSDAPARLAKSLPRYPIPILPLARLAVDQTWQGRGLGAALLADAMRRTLQDADLVGVHALMVHAKDEEAKCFYEHFGFEPFPGEPLTLYRLLKDLRLMTGG